MQLFDRSVKIAAADTYPQWMMMRPNLAAAVDLVIWHTYAYWAGSDIANGWAGFIDGAIESGLNAGRWAASAAV